MNRLTQGTIRLHLGLLQVATQQMRSLVLLGLVAALLGPSVGCSDGRPARVTVSGQVLIDGEPLSQGNIKFVPEGARPSAGTIAEDGRFTLTCYDGNDGVVPGTHRVQISASEILGESKIKWWAPKKYCDFRISGLTFEITEPTDDLKIELTWDGGKPYIE
jgi:hypothetical protein